MEKSFGDGVFACQAKVLDVLQARRLAVIEYWTPDGSKLFDEISYLMEIIGKIDEKACNGD